MKLIINEENFLLARFDRGEEFIKEFSKVMEDLKWQSGVLWGIGGAQRLELGFYDLDRKEYIKKIFSGGSFEALSLTGNFVFISEKPFLHIHGSFAGKDFKSFGGHVFELDVGGTLEVWCQRENFSRKLDDNTGLNIIICSQNNHL